MSELIPTILDVRSAAERIRGSAVHTPLLRSDFLDELVGTNVFLKPECLQRTGSFKFRGACNALAAMSPETRANGVIAVSSGNHGQGVAEAARIFVVPATIIMPSDAPATKVERTRRSGATVVFYDRLHEDREEVANALRASTNAAFVHPYENAFVIAGQGTAGLEIVADLQAMGQVPDHMLVCTGGGGLTAGIALAISDSFPECGIHSCEPEGFDDYRRSLISGKREINDTRGGSVCDAIVTPQPGAVSFEINSRLLAEGLAASDEDALLATAFAFRELKLVVEPGGAIALACLIRHRERFAGKCVVVTLSGGNMDADVLNRALELQADRPDYV